MKTPKASLVKRVRNLTLAAGVPRRPRELSTPAKVAAALARGEKAVLREKKADSSIPRLSSLRTNAAETLVDLLTTFGDDLAELVQLAWWTHSSDGCIMLELIHYLLCGSPHGDANEDKAGRGVLSR